MYEQKARIYIEQAISHEIHINRKIIYINAF